ncbi:hypothetical protein ABC347_10850 [Sphingomonas sp. 1P06PA]|uniref:carph-isopro domain-containing protein n=1 Tax=Sphingomonas sp. 1P06PA TaxID=554121 RepID=UPI0039A596AF
MVAEIFEGLGRPTHVAADLGFPVQTVHSWKKKGNIPGWRRPAVLDLARRRNLALSAEAWAYLVAAPVSTTPALAS